MESPDTTVDDTTTTLQPTNPPDKVPPPTLIGILSNPLFLYHTIPYLPISSTLALGATSKSFANLIFHTPSVFRYLDLRNVQRAQTFNVGSMNRRGQVVGRSIYGEVEDDFYTGPIKSIFMDLQGKHWLKDVQTLILDGLSVPADLLSEIILDSSYNVKLLSIRQVQNLKQGRLIEALRYACRPTRPKNTPCLKGIYVFGPRDEVIQKLPPSQVTMTISSSWNRKSSDHLSESLHGTTDKWYQKSGRMVKKELFYYDWAIALRECEGIISFDAPLCTGPRHVVLTDTEDSEPDSVPWYQQPKLYLPPRVATFALNGCHSCGKAPEGLSIFDKASLEKFPLLSPLPIHSSTVKAAKTPIVSPNSSVQPQMIARCQDCLPQRFCETCFKWWCEDCLDHRTASKNYDNHLDTEGNSLETWRKLTTSAAEGNLSRWEEIGCKVLLGSCFDHYKKVPSKLSDITRLLGSI